MKNISLRKVLWFVQSLKLNFQCIETNFHFRKCKQIETPIPSPPTSTSMPDSPSMKIEMCLLPGNYGRSQLAHLSLNVVLVNCKPWEICVKSGSNLLGNELGYV